MTPKLPRTSVLDEVGNPDAAPGSAAWSRWFVVRAKKYRRDLNSDAATLVELMDKLARFKAAQALGYASFEMLAQVEVELTSEDLDRLRKAEPGASVDIALGQHGGAREGAGRPLKGETVEKVLSKHGGKRNQDNNVTLIKGNASEYLTALLARDHPEMLVRLANGEFKSVRAAAIAAGIVQPSFRCPADPVKAAQRLWKRFQGKDWASLVRAMAEAAEEAKP